MNQVSDPFFTLPQSLVRKGHLAKMRGSEVSLLVFLYHEMERLSKPGFELINLEIELQTNASVSSIRIARTKLMERGLISIKRVRGGIYEYTLLDPNTGRAWKRVTPRRNPSRAEIEVSTQRLPQNANLLAQGVELDWN